MNAPQAPLVEELINRHSQIETAPGAEITNSAPVIEASKGIAAIYMRLLSEGMEQDVVGRAMIGATINFYDALGLDHILPEVLRRVASNLERRALKPH